MWTDYDVIVIGGGPAGLAASLYTSRAGLETLILEKGGPGGELMNRQLIENYPGFSAGIQGPDLGSAMSTQTESFGTEFELGAVTSIEVKDNFKVVKTEEDSFSCKGIIIASGSVNRKLNVPGEEEFSHKGVFYCATCDGPGFADKAVLVVGGGDSGVTEALELSRYCTKVTIVELMEKPKASQVLLNRATENPKIELFCATKVNQIFGDDHVSSVELEDLASGEKRKLDVEGVCVRIGLIPNTQFLNGVLELTPLGQVPVNINMETSIPGILAAGDVRQYSAVQMATATGDGVTAAMALGRYLETI